MDKTLQKKRDRTQETLRGKFRRARILLTGTLLLALAPAGLSCSPEELVSNPGEETRFLLERDRESLVPLPETKEFAEDALIVYAGILVDKVYELSLVSRTFSAVASTMMKSSFGGTPLARSTCRWLSKWRRPPCRTNTPEFSCFHTITPMALWGVRET
jgi:hypothetical protein